VPIDEQVLLIGPTPAAPPRRNAATHERAQCRSAPVIARPLV
jgi:hypothetical protein